jgi:high-affinity iron transporter
MLAPLLVMVREGFEAALIVAIVLAYLRRTGRLDMVRPVWMGVAAAAGLAIAIGVIIDLSIGTLEGAARLRAFAAISLVAASVLTWMVFWMRRQARAIKGELESQIDEALVSRNASRAIAAVAFFAVLREGIEAALFMLAATTTASGGRVLAGALLGLAVAAVLGYLVYVGGRRLPLRTFFKITGIILIVFAGGLLARTVLFLQSAGDLGTLDNAVYDLTRYAFLTQQTEVGRFLAAMVGWDPRPSIEQVVVYLGYVVPVLWLFLRSPRQPARQPEAAAAAARG